jgi:hypothetical protein
LAARHLINIKLLLKIGLALSPAGLSFLHLRAEPIVITLPNRRIDLDIGTAGS